MTTTNEVTLTPVLEEDFQLMQEELHASFLKGLHDQFVDVEDPAAIAPIPSKESIAASFNNEKATVRHLLVNNERIGGVVLQIDEETGRNEVDFFYTLATAHSKGLGTKAWFAIEQAFPQTKIWELYTPYFEKRNIHFYVNKCGFNIVEFYHRGNPGPNIEGEQPVTDADYEFFRFEKVMTSIK